MKQGHRFFLGLLASGLCLWFVLGDFLGGENTTHIMAKVKDINKGWTSLAIGCLILSYPLNTIRLKYVLNLDIAISCRFSQILPIVWVSSFLSLVAPSAAFSDGIRATLLRVNQVSNLSLAVRAVLVDRVMGLIYTLGLAGILLLILPAGLNPGISNYWGLIFLLGFFGTIAVSFFVSKLIKKIQFIEWIQTMLEDIVHLMTSPKAIVVFMTFALLNTLILAFSLWFISLGFSLNPSFWAFFLLTPAILIINNLPIFYQGFGGREAMMLFAFGGSSADIPPEMVITISLVSGLGMMVSALFGSLFLPFLLTQRNRLTLS